MTRCVFKNVTTCFNVRMNESKYFGVRVKTLRKERKLTQAALAEACGWSQSRIGNYEVGRREPSFADVAKIAEVLGVSPEVLFTDFQRLQDEPSNIEAGELQAEPLRDASPSAHLTIRAYKSWTSRDHGNLPDGYVNSCPEITLSKQSLIAMGITDDALPHLALISPWEQDMHGTFSAYSPLVVDASAHRFTGDGIYLFTWLGDLHLRRIERVDAQKLELIPDNPKYSRRTVDSRAVKIHAKVLLILSPQRA
ncbi:XRE family transcriptional regulator [Pseudomonas putida]|nr:LexA family transcriptional regulator [Pseudomonas putida]